MEKNNNTLIAWVNTNYRLVEMATIAAAAIAGLVNTSVQAKITMIETRSTVDLAVARMEHGLEKSRLENNKAIEQLRSETDKRQRLIERQLDNVTLDLETQRREVREDMQLLREGRASRPSR